jgi:hypothetical protein
VANDDAEELLDQSESLDSDEIRNDDGDEVVDPPEQWLDAVDNESLDEKLAAEIPDNGGDQGGGDQEGGDQRGVDQEWSEPAFDPDGRGVQLLSDDDLDRIDPEVHGRQRGQISGTPEDGDSFFNVER